MSRFVKNPKSSLMFSYLQVVWHLWCRWVTLAFLTNCLSVCKYVRSGGEVIAVMCFALLTNLFTEFTVICLFTRNLDRKWLVELTVPFLQWHNYPLGHLLSTALDLVLVWQCVHSIIKKRKSTAWLRPSINQFEIDWKHIQSPLYYDSSDKASFEKLQCSREYKNS